MTWIKNFVLIIIVILVCYGLLVVSDWYIQLTIDRRNDAVALEAKSLENERIAEQDLAMREAAVSEGYIPMLYPTLVDDQELDYPLIGAVPKARTYYCNEGYGLVKYVSDRFGFRNDDRLWDAKTLDVLIGDSFVHGACVDDEQTLPNRVAELSGVATLNLGMGGNSASHYLTYARLFIPKLRPRRVVLVFYPNDLGAFEPSQIEKRYIDEGKQLFASGTRQVVDPRNMKRTGFALIEKMAERDAAPARETSQLNRYAQAFARHSSLPTTRSLLFTGFDQRYQSTQGAIETTAQLCSIYACRLTVAFIPNSTFYRPDSEADRYGDRIGEQAQSLGIAFVDGRDVIDRSKGSADFAPQGPHLSPLGYQKMATHIFESY